MLKDVAYARNTESGCNFRISMCSSEVVLIFKPSFEIIIASYYWTHDWHRQWILQKQKLIK